MIRALALAGKAILISSHILTELAEICDSVGIIEQGRLLAVGTVAEMKQRLVSQTSIRLTVLQRVHEAMAWLAAQPAVSHVELQAAEIVLTFGGDEKERAQLLRDLVRDGFEVATFGVQDRNLEEVFLNVTRGRVQ